MKLPLAQNAYVDASKVRDYLLSSEHPVGRHKAALFVSFGYHRADWRRLRRDLKGIAIRGTAELITAGEFGRKFQIRGILQTPSGRPLRVVTVWIVRSGDSFPRFVTAYPDSSW